MQDDSLPLDSTLKTSHNNGEADNFYAECMPELEKLEGIRLDKLAIYNLRKKLATGLSVVLVPAFGYVDFWLLGLQRGDGNSFAGVTVLAMAALWTWVNRPKRSYTKAYKKKILPNLASLFGNFEYQHDGKIDMDQMQPTKIIPHHHKYKSEDYFSGQYKNVAIEFCEMRLTKKKKSGKRTRTVTVFKGLAIHLKFQAKKFYGHTIVQKDQGKLGEWFKEKGSNLKRANLVDPEFEAAFDAYTNDQVEARYLIDPIMIEKIKSLYSEYNGKAISLAFHDEQMLILIASNHNHFEPANIHTLATTPESLMSMKREIENIISIIDKLSLYNPRDAHNE